MRKFHPNGWICRLLTEKIIKHLVFDLIERTGIVRLAVASAGKIGHEESFRLCIAAG